MTHTIDLTSIAQNFGNEGKIVGFANKYYTLWTYKITANEATNDLSFDAYFVKNIGLTNPYAGVCPFDKGLKGVEIHITSYCTETGLQLTPQQFKALQFSRGNEKGLLISECNSIDSLVWKYNARFVSRTITDDRRKAELTNIANRAIELGAVEINGILYRPQDVDTTIFSRNPFCGEKIAECTDDGALCWKFNKHAVNEYHLEEVQEGELNNIKARAIELGAIEINGMLYSTETQKKDWFITENELLNKLENNQPAIIEAKHNLNGNGCYDTLFVNLHFDNHYYPCTYYGPAYCLPLDKKGHGKRIKGTNICIIKAEKIDGKNYKVINWEIVK